jgi:hypothetical protein
LISFAASLIGMVVAFLGFFSYSVQKRRK